MARSIEMVQKDFDFQWRLDSFLSLDRTGVFEVYRIPPSLRDNPGIRDQCIDLQKNTLHVCRLWFTDYYLDFTDEMKTDLQSFVEKARKDDETVFVARRFLEKTVEKKVPEPFYV